MPLQLFLNDLSSSPDTLSHQVSVQYLKELVATTRQAREIAMDIVLNCSTPINTFPICANVTIATVRNAGDCVDESLFLKTLVSRSPLTQALPVAQLGQLADLDYHIVPHAPICSEKKAEALGLAHMCGGLGISIPSHEFWMNAAIPLNRLTLEGDGELRSEEVVARNASCRDHIVQQEEVLREITRPRFLSGRQLWADRAQFFPNLKFLQRTRQQLEAILPGDPMLNSVGEKLVAIDRAIDLWRQTGSPQNVFPFSVRHESKSRMHLTLFNDETGTPRYFSLHADFTPGEGRLHFILESEPVRCAIVGHIGRKLGIG